MTAIIIATQTPTVAPAAAFVSWTGPSGTRIRGEIDYVPPLCQSMNAATSLTADCPPPGCGPATSTSSTGSQNSVTEKSGPNAPPPGACTAAPHLYSNAAAAAAAAALQQQYAAALSANANVHRPYAPQQPSGADNAGGTAAPSELVGKKRSAETDIFQLVFLFIMISSLVVLTTHVHRPTPCCSSPPPPTTPPHAARLLWLNFLACACDCVTRIGDDRERRQPVR